MFKRFVRQLNKTGSIPAFFARLAKSPLLEPAIFLVMLVVFVVCAAYFALHLHKAIVPDEPGHFYISTLFAGTWGTPQPTDYSFALGNSQFNRQPFIYYWINGRLLNLLTLIMPAVSEWRQLLFLRLVSVIYSTLTVIYTYFLALEIIRKRWWPLLVVFLSTSTLMFVFLSGGVSYDNLANLCAVAGTYYLVKVLKGQKIITHSLFWIFVIGLGVLAKKTILPLAAVMFIFWLVYMIRNRRMINLKSERKWQLVVTGLLALLTIGLNLSVYGVNLVRFGEPIPDCTDIYAQQQCDLSVFVRRAKEMGFPEEKLTLRDVIEQRKTNPLTYLDEYWFNRMLTTIYGIMGHQAYYPTLIITFYWLLYIFIFIIAIKYWEKRDYIFYTLLALVISYTIAIFLESYNEELMSGFRHVAIQGRYLFPVLGILYVLIADFLSRISHGLVRRLSVAYTLFLFALGGPVLFLLFFAARNQLAWFY